LRRAPGTPHPPRGLSRIFACWRIARSRLGADAPPALRSYASLASRLLARHRSGRAVVYAEWSTIPHQRLRHSSSPRRRSDSVVTTPRGLACWLGIAPAEQSSMQNGQPFRISDCSPSSLCECLARCQAAEVLLCTGRVRP